MSNPKYGLSWHSHNMFGEDYPLEHLHPQKVTITIPAKGKNPERNLSVAISYSIHCFTHKQEDSEQLSTEETYSDSRETRAFDIERWKLSKHLPEIINTLDQRRCLHTGREEFVTVDIVENGRTIEYAVFFTVTKGGKSGCDLNLYVNSAHERNQPLRYKKPIRFHFILMNRYQNKQIKPPP